ncbi:MAG TPA: hypothetical protein PKD53_10745 [Chloroflexaceae bacterium]|nr:hypothetical protein [Chloroflexaceae bacterium]
MTPRPPTKLIGAVAALVIGLLALSGCGLQPSARVVEPVGPALSANLGLPVAVAPALAPAQALAPAVAGTLEVRVVSLAFERRALDVAAPGSYRVRLVNSDAVPHEILFDDGTRIAVAPGEVGTALVEIPAEGATFLCAIPAHRDAGMVGQVSVTK